MPLNSARWAVGLLPFTLLGCGAVATLNVRLNLPAARDSYRFVRVTNNPGRYGAGNSERLLYVPRRMEFVTRLLPREANLEITLRQRQSPCYCRLKNMNRVQGKP